MNRLRRLVAVLSLIVAPAALAQDVAVERGVPVSGTLGPADTLSYAIELDSATFVYGTADQQTVDVVLALFDPEGERVGFWRDASDRGPERFQFDTEAAGLHRLVVTPVSEQSGDFVLLLQRVEPVATDPEDRVRQLMAPFSGTGTPGGVVAVIRDGRVAFAEAFGMANLTHGIPFTVETRTNIGSVSKQFTAFGLALLESRGELSLDDDVRDYLPELPPFDQPVTIRNLLNHTGGYRELYNTVPMAGWRGEDALERDEAIRIVQRQDALQTAPGSEFNYNNTGYILVATIVERVTGQAFPEWMLANVFGPLGMERTVIKSYQGEVIPNSAQGYVRTEDGPFREARDLAASYGAGGIYTTVGDLARWLGNFGDPTVGDSAVMARMVERPVLASGDTGSYALGLGIGERQGMAMVSHGGADIAHRARLMYFPDIDAGVAVLSNDASFNGRIPGATVDAFFADYQSGDEDAEAPDEGAAVTVAPEVIDRYVGRYEFEGIGLLITYTRDGDRFWAQATGQPEIDLIARSDSTFDYQGVVATVTFHANGSEPVESATHEQGGQSITLNRLPPWAPSAEELQAYRGRYFSAELETFYTIVVEDTTLMVQSRRFADDVALTPKAEDVFTGGAFFLGEVEFTRGDDGTVGGFLVSNGRTRGVVFSRDPTAGP
jgi:CubicO group peptidase (beta-lactamase class C family)